MSKEKIISLNVYLDKVTSLVKSTEGAKKQFFEREVRKTLAKIKELTA